MKKRMKALLAILLVVSLFASCAKKSPETTVEAAKPVSTEVKSEKAELTLMGGAHLVSVAEVVLRDFLAANPDITINFEKYSYAEYPTKMKIALSEGDSTPDIMIIHDLFIRQFVNAGFLMDLTDCVDRTKTLDIFAPVEKGSKIYGIPNQVTNQYVFLYRRDIYENLGLTVPTTFDEYFEQAIKIKEAGYYAGAWDPSNSNCADMFLNYVYMLGGEVLDKEGNVSLAKAEEAIDLIKKCMDAGIFHNSISSDSEQYWTAFNAGKIAAFPGVGAHAAYYETSVNPSGNGGYGKLGIAPAIKFSAEGPSTYINNTEFYAINKKTKYPEAAKKVVEYLSQSVEAALKFSNVNENGLMARFGTGYIPGLEAIAKGERVDGWASFGGEKVVSFLASNLADNADTIVLPFVDSRSSEIKSIIAEVLGETFLKGKYTSAEAIAEMKNRINQI